MNITIQKAWQNNLKGVSLEIPHYKLIGVVGVSGSGKSSLAFDVIANAGRREYMETIPSFARQFSGRIDKPSVESISGLFPVIAVEQFKSSGLSGSTVGTFTEIYDDLRLLFARYGSEKGLSKSHFSFNTDLGKCSCCAGIGKEERISVSKLVADPNKTLREGALVPTLPNGYIMYSQVTVDVLDTVCREHGFNVDIPWKDLSEDQVDVILNGSDRIKVPFGKHSIESRLKWTGLKAKPREEGFYKGILPIMKDILKRDRNKNILRFVESIECIECHGRRIGPLARASKWQSEEIGDLTELTLNELVERLTRVNRISEGEVKIIKHILSQVNPMIELGLRRTSLATRISDLKPTQIQRLKVCNQLKTDLSNVLYVFDEPTLGMNNEQKSTLLRILRSLVNKGNTVIVVEHDLAFIKSTDWIVEIGPKSGIDGGELVFSGLTSGFIEGNTTPTQRAIQNPSPSQNIKFEVIDYLKTDLSLSPTDKLVDQKPIGRTPRSNPATYTGLGDLIRDEFAKLEESKEKGYKKGRFSFNNKGGRCETCEGAGKIQIGVHYMGKVELECETCEGMRFNEETLEIKLNEKNIHQVYQMSVNQALSFFEKEPKISRILSLLVDLGLGYIQLGQSSTTLSGGEAQRIKLATLLSKKTKSTIVLEEPANGLHHENVLELIHTLNKISHDNKVVCYTSHPLLLGNKELVVDEKVNGKVHEEIELCNVTTNNLKNIDVRFPKNKISVITGLSGSGKSSLAFDTLFAESNTRFSASLSNYSKSFIRQSNPAVAEEFKGLTPSIAVNRKNLPKSPRSTVGTLTGISEKLRFLFSRHGNVSAKSLSFNSEHGMCLDCSGLGEKLKAQRHLLVKNWDLSIDEGAFTHNSAIKYYGQPDSQFIALLRAAGDSSITSTPISQLNNKQLDLIFEGSGDAVWQTTWNFKNSSREGSQEISGPWIGLSNLVNNEFEKVQNNKKIDALKSLMAYETCNSCGGQRLNDKARSIKINDKSIADIGELSIHDLEKWIDSTSFPIPEFKDLLFEQISPLIKTLKELGLGHLSTNRRSETLSGGEGQRLRLAQVICNSLTGITYVLDEPTIGLHDENVKSLWKAIESLKNKGNTIILVEHDPYIISKADNIIELGPGSGEEGGQLVPPRNQSVEFQPFPKKESGSIVIKSANIFSLANRDFQFKLNQLNVIVGLSGSGKSTLLNKVLYPSLIRSKPVNCKSINSDRPFQEIIKLDQSSFVGSKHITVSSFLRLTNLLAKKFSSLPEAKSSGMKKNSFLYTHKDGRCKQCNGVGSTMIQLDHLDSLDNDCDSCSGLRYNKEALSIKLNDKSLGDLLQLSVKGLLKANIMNEINEEASLLLELGLGHLSIGQTTSSLSGGEAQRLRLAKQLKGMQSNSLILLDEPTSGLSITDIEKLLNLFRKLIDKGSTIICIEHNQSFIEVASHVQEV